MRANLSKRRNIWSTNNFAFLQADADGYIAVNCSSEDDGDDGGHGGDNDDDDGGQGDDDDGGGDGGHGDDNDDDDDGGGDAKFLTNKQLYVPESFRISCRLTKKEKQRLSQNMIAMAKYTQKILTWPNIMILSTAYLI